MMKGVIKASRGAAWSIWLALACTSFGQAGTQRTEGGTSASAKGSGTQHSGYGSVPGRVFAITNGGDLKPGRFAKVYFFFDSKTSGGRVVGSGEGTAGVFFLDENLKGLQENTKKMEQSLKQHEDLPSEAIMCTDKLLVADKAIIATLDWAQKTQHLSSIYMADTDEDGNFRIDKVQPGSYVAVARGQAGVDDVYWHEDLILEPKGSVIVKLHSVDTACIPLTE
jgi:hypothetical protein